METDIEKIVNELLEKIPENELREIFETFDAFENCGMTIEEYEEWMNSPRNPAWKKESDETLEK